MTVYFAVCPVTKVVKIGYSKNPIARVKAIKSVYRRKHLELRHIIAGDITTEAETHEKYASLRIYGEWFAYKGKLKRFLDKQPPAPKHRSKWVSPDIGTQFENFPRMIEAREDAAQCTSTK